MKQKRIGQTQTAGFQIGVRRTFPVSVQEAWDLLISEQGQKIWLGEACLAQMEEGASYRLSSGAGGVVRVVNPGVNLRLSWQPEGWERASTIQIRTIAHGSNVTISFHQEGLPGAKERASRRRYWQQVQAELQRLFERPAEV